MLIAGCFLFLQSVQAAGPPGTLPTGGTYTAGNGSIHASGNAMTITQSSSKGIIDWTAFSIGAANQVNFLNGSGATLNRVTSDQMSSLLGTLRSSGALYLINPNGILIGPKGKIHTGGDFVASTLNLSNSTFLNGGALLFQGDSTAFVKNLGMISSDGGSILLIANNVQNAGSIVAPNGTAGLAAGQQVLFKNSADDQRVFVQASGGDITNSGSISAAQAEIRSNGGNIYAIAGNNNTGIIRATGTATKDGQVWLIAENGTANVSGTISAQNANGTAGDVETSGDHLNICGANVSTGKGGNWLLDPVDLTIDSAAASSIDSALSSSNVTVSTSASGSSGFGTVNPSGSGDIDVTSGISWNSANSLTLSAYRNINVTAGISNGGSGNLTLQADNAATESGTVAFSGSGGVIFTGSGNVNVYYHPSGYPTATSYASKIAMGGGALTAYMTVDSMTDLQNVNNNLSGTYALNTNLNATSVSFTQIADGSDNYNSSSGFSGLFDGQGHTISNLTPNTSTSDENAGGLFNQISFSGTVRNLGLVNLTVSGQATQNNNQYSGQFIGGLAGENFGTIADVYTTGSVSLGSTAGYPALVGGLVGNNDGKISNTWSSVSVLATDSNGDWVGGLVGYNGWNSYGSANTTISSSYSVGAVSGGAYSAVGGFAGENDAYISNSYFDTNTSGQSTGVPDISGPTTQVTGLTTTTFQNGTLPSGLGSPNSSAWIAQSGSYPKLTWQIPPPPSGISVSGSVFNGGAGLSGVTVAGLASGTSFGTTTSGSNGAFTLTAPAGAAGVLLYLTGGSYTGNTYSDILTAGAFSGVDIYTGQIRVISASSLYSGIASALIATLGSNAGSNFLFTNNSGVITPTAGTQLSLINSAAAFTVDQQIAASGPVVISSAGSLTIGSSTSISSTASGRAITLSTGGTFTNSAGSGALSATNGNWLVYSQNPTNDSLGSLAYAFKQYDATYGSTTVLGTGNGLLYTNAPTLTVSLMGTATKTYDGLTSATISSSNYNVSGGVALDTVTISGTAAYANANQGSGKSVSVSGISATAVDGTGAPVYGYQLNSTSASGNIGVIDPAVLIYTANSASKIYAGTNPSFSGTVTGFVDGQTLGSATTGAPSFTTTATTGSNVGSYAVNGSGLTADNGNYTFQQGAGNATALTINPALLTYTSLAASKTYGSANPSLTGTVSGFVNGDTLNSATTGTGIFTTPATAASHVGAYAIDGSGLTAANYTFQQSPGNSAALTIDPAVLTATITAANKVYDGSTTATGSMTLHGVVNNDSISVSGDTYVFSTKNAGTNKTVTESGASLMGAAAGNYVLSSADATTATIYQKTLTATTTAQSKVYDGGTGTSGTMTLNGVVAGDTVSATGDTFAFTDKNAGTDKTVVELGASLTGPDAANYSLGTVATASANIAQKPLTGLIDAVNKTFDGTVTDAAQLTLQGVVPGDAVSTAASFAFNNANAGNNKTVSLVSATLNGPEAQNYVLGTVTAGSASIIPATVSVTVNNTTETAAQSNPPAFSAIYSGSVIPGVDISQLLSTLLFSTNQPSATAIGTFQISASTADANVNLVVTPGILSVVPAPPQVGSSLVSAQTNPPPLPALQNIPASLFGYTGSGTYSTGWTGLITAANNSVNSMSSASFLDTNSNGVNENTGKREP